MAGKIIKGDAFAEAMAERPERPERIVERPERPAPRARPGVVDSEVYEAHQKAREIVEQARQEAEQILAIAEQQREERLEEAREAGRQEGLAQATEVLAKAHQERGEMMAGAEAQLVELSLQIAEKIVGRAIELDRELVLNIVAQAIESVRQQKELVIRVSPDDALLLRNSRKKLMDLLGRARDIAVREDPEIARGGCIIETENGTVDAQLRTQIQMLEQFLLGDRKR